MSNQIIVRTLLGATSFRESITCLPSLVKYATESITLLIHEDGTLTEAHRDRLREVCPRASFVPRAEADEAVDVQLVHHPRCAAARRSNVLFLKLFDIALLSHHELIYVDSDVLFLRPYSRLFQGHADVPVFMTDRNHAYSIRPWRAWPLGNVRLAGHVNTGVITGWKGGLDLDFLEWLLGLLERDPAYRRRSHWVEQTCWAALAARSGCSLLDSRQFILASERMREYSSETVAIHFVSTYRERLHCFRERVRPNDESPAEVVVRDSCQVSAIRLLCADIQRRVFSER